MTQSSSQATAFYRDVAKNGVMWTVEDDGGVPAPMNRDGQRCMPFWSSRARVEKVIKTVPAYRSFRPLELSWTEFIKDWVPDLAQDGLLIGVNWSGPHARGYDLRPDEVVRNVSHFISHPDAQSTHGFPLRKKSSRTGG